VSFSGSAAAGEISVAADTGANAITDGAATLREVCEG
jgi:hypothetical protein